MIHPEAPPADRFCDLVMKGGITSGVVYPRAIGLLSKHYRFKSIGGTSAGAIAAAVTAAAEYQRRSSGSLAGFERLAKLPEELKKKVPGTGHSTLRSLFQPQPAAARLFAVLAASLNSASTLTRALRIVGGFLLAYWPATLTSVAAAALAWWFLGAFTALLVLALAAPVLVGLWVYRDLTHNVVQNGFGLCTGLTEDRTPALTPWLHDLIQRAAGRPANADPLTFGDLWNVDKAPSWAPDPDNWRSIDLQMFTTSLSHGRPYVFPLAKQDTSPSRFRSRDRLYFRPSELARYLPEQVLAWMVKKSRPYTIEPGREAKDPPSSVAGDLRELPDPECMPVLLAARMSLSFPLLFSAVPLWAIDHTPAPGPRRFRPCWFSDGGISSNFPMHLFDGLVPSWPTFGINLEDEVEGGDATYLPQRYETGYGERWNGFADPNQKSASQFGGFLSTIINTMQNWNDNSLSRMPGVRDRIARVRLAPDEGGMNLDMKEDTIESVANKGCDAALRLLARFAVGPPGRQAPGWDEHRFVRLNILARMIAERTPGVGLALSARVPHATDFSTLLADFGAATTPAPGYETTMTAAQLTALNGVIAALGDLAAALDPSTRKLDFKPIPKPELRVRPPL